MTTILVLGAGRSSSFLIRYLLEHAGEMNWHVLLGDISEEAARQRLSNDRRGEFVFFDIANHGLFLFCRHPFIRV
jgi:hypothetical protein